jgi:hypothetical protein
MKAVIIASPASPALHRVWDFLNRIARKKCELDEGDMSEAAAKQEWVSETITHHYHDCFGECQYHQLADLLGELADPNEGLNLQGILDDALGITKALLAELSKAPKAGVSKAPKAGVSKAPKAGVSKATKARVSKAPKAP